DPWSDLVIDPKTTTKGGSKATLYTAVGNAFGSASNSNGVYQSTDSGATWSPVNGVPGIAGAGRISLAVSHPTTDAFATLYVLAATPLQNGVSNLQAFDVFTNVSPSGTPTWTQRTSTPDVFIENGQGFYDNVVAADPTTPNTVYVGGEGGPNSIIMSTNGGASSTNLSIDFFGGGPHPDHHALVVDGPGRLLEGNGGGVWRLGFDNFSGPFWEDLNGWETLNATGLSINQVTGIALSPTSSQMILAGSQDNGTNLFQGGQSGPFVSAWTNVDGGDGGFVRINAANTAYYTFGYPSTDPNTGSPNDIKRITGLGQTNTLTNINGTAPTSIGTSVILGVSNAVNPTITTSTPHGLSKGQTVMITGGVFATGAAGLNGPFVVTGVPSTTTFTIATKDAP